MQNPPEARLTFAANLKAMRIKKGFVTARSLADALDVDVVRYMRFERSETEPSFETLVKICKVLATTPNALLGYADEGNNVC